MTHTPTFDDFSVRLDELGLFHMDLTLDRMAAFFKRHGQWVTAEELTVDGMRKAVKDMGL